MSEAAIRALVRDNPGQATVDEYRRVHDAVSRRAPCRLLVFGVGRDAPLWIEANAGGRTVFVEDDRKWLNALREETTGAELYHVPYRTVRALWPFLRRLGGSLLLRGLPAQVLATRWDVIFVDGPRGTRWHAPGRMRSIYTAAALSASGGDVLVHDCHRDVERDCCDAYLGGSRLVGQVGSLRHYRTP